MIIIRGIPSSVLVLVSTYVVHNYLVSVGVKSTMKLNIYDNCVDNAFDHVVSHMLGLSICRESQRLIHSTHTAPHGGSRSMY